MPKLALGALTPDTRAHRRAITTIGDSDIARTRVFIQSWTGEGMAPKAGGGSEEITADDARKIALNANVKWDAAQAAYLYKGVPIDFSVIKAGTDVALSNAASKVNVLATQATSGLIDADTLYNGTLSAMVDGYTASAAMAHGGIDNLTQAARDRIQKAVLERIEGRAQTEQQRGFPGLRAIVEAATKGDYDDDLEELGADLTGTMDGSRILYENEKQVVSAEAGLDQKCRILGGNANHCPNCLDIAAEGWVPNDGRNPVGGDFCQDDCTCTEVYRRSDSPFESPAVLRSIEYAKEKQAAYRLAKAEIAARKLL